MGRLKVLATTLRPRPLMLRGLGVALVVFVQWQIVTIPRVDTADFDRYAFELERTRGWRYGYVMQYHGAGLVKTALTAGVPALRPPGPDDRLTAAMTRELRGASSAAILELVFYAALWGLARLVLPRMPWSRLRSVSPRRLGAARAALSTAAFVTMAMAPYVVAGYGEPLFSNLAGPGALSSTGLVPTTGGVTSAVSYGILLEALLIWPMIATLSTAEPLSRLLGIRGSLWLVACSFWGTGAAVLVLASAGLERRAVRS